MLGVVVWLYCLLCGLFTMDFAVCGLVLLCCRGLACLMFGLLFCRGLVVLGFCCGVL